MNMPGFHAERSVYSTSHTYQAAYSTVAGHASTMVMSRQLMTSAFGFFSCETLCLATGCVPFCTRSGRVGLDEAACIAACFASPSATCTLLCGGGGGGTSFPSGSPTCSD